jgi:hypothetical protein
MKKKQRITLANLGQIPLTPVVNKTGWKSRAELEAEWKDLAEKPTRDAIALQEATYRKLLVLASEFWSRPIDQIIPEIYSDSSKSMTLNVPATRAEYERADMEKAADIWYYTIFKPLGFDLNPIGATRQRAFIDASAFHGFDMSAPSNIHASWLHLKDDLHAFADGELIGVPQDQPVETPAEPQPSLESLCLESDSQRKVAQQIVAEDYFASVAPLHQAWMQSLAENFNGFRPTLADLKYLYGETPETGWFAKSNLSRLSPRSYDSARRHMCAIRRWDENRMLTNDEMVCREIEQEQTPLAKMGFYDKRDLKTKIMRLTDRF